MSLIEIKGLSCGYGGGDVVKNVSFEAERGEITALAGPNGCGKTTLLRALCGAVTPSAGDIVIEGSSALKMSARERAKRIALLSQTGAGGDYFDYTVFDTVLMGRYARLKGKLFPETSEEDVMTVKKYISETVLEDCEKRLITELSGGQLQRALLARAFAQEPDILLLDEPANHLDIQSQRELAGLLKRFADSGKTVIGVFHDISFAAFVSDRIMLMRGGERIMYEAVPDVLRSEELAEVFGTDVREYMKSIYKIWDK